jgi:YggT family protein
MKDALTYLVDSLLTIYLYVLVLRFVMQLTRADFRNPISHFVTTVTNPLIMPLRRILPPMGKIDTATVIVLVLFLAVKIALLSLIEGRGALVVYPFDNLAFRPPTFVIALVFELIRTFLTFFLFAVIIFAVLSFVVQGNYSPPYALLGTVCEPVLKPFRRIIPPIAGWDLSALWATLILGLLLRILPQLFAYTIT